MRVNSLEVTELESFNFDCNFKSLFLLFFTPGSERVNSKHSMLLYANIIFDIIRAWNDLFWVALRVCKRFVVPKIEALRS